MLEVKNMCVAYGQHRALEDVSVSVDRGEIVTILGANGAGKSTLLRAIAGTCEGSVTGHVVVDGEPIVGLPPHEIVRQGIALVPEGRGVFPDLTVLENLTLGAYTNRARADESANMDRLLALFPKLGERRKQVVRTMSGGEQQMVAIGRAMMSSPDILMLDEPSLGLSPLLCKELFHSLSEVRKAGLGILLVEQNAKQSLAIADRGYLLENAHIIGEDTAVNLAGDPTVQKAYLGVSSGPPPTVPAAPRKPAAPDPQAEARAAAKDALAFIASGNGKHRARTEDVVSGGIDDLVRHAASISAERTGRAGPKPEAAQGRPPAAAPRQNDRLGEVLAEIEKAALGARRKSNGAARKPITAPPTPGRQAQSADAEDLPDIEVWRRSPQIEIYRRENGQLKRVKGE